MLKSDTKMQFRGVLALVCKKCIYIDPDKYYRNQYDDPSTKQNSLADLTTWIVRPIHILTESQVNNNLMDGCCFFEVVALHLKSKYSSSEYNWTALGDIKPLAPSLLALDVLAFVEWRRGEERSGGTNSWSGTVGGGLESIKLAYMAIVLVTHQSNSGIFDDTVSSVRVVSDCQEYQKYNFRFILLT